MHNEGRGLFNLNLRKSKIQNDSTAPFSAHAIDQIFQGVEANIGVHVVTLKTGH